MYGVQCTRPRNPKQQCDLLSTYDNSSSIMIKKIILRNGDDPVLASGRTYKLLNRKILAIGFKNHVGIKS